ncbi:MAG: DNA/RNA non-specific endonuclease [Microbacterium sp.]
MPRTARHRGLFTRCSTGRHRSSAVPSAFTAGRYTRGVLMDGWLLDVAADPWALALLFAVVLADAFLVVVPGEAAVSAFGALAVSTGSPPLAAVIAVGAAAAFCGDACCYLIGRTVGIARWRWMRHARVQAAFGWAQQRLDRSTAVVVFTARFIPFARLAVNLVAGASRVPAPRYLAVVGVAGIGWSAYQSIVGAVVGLLVPGGPVVAVIVSIVVAVGLGFAVDAAVSRIARRRRALSTDSAAQRALRKDDLMADTGYDDAFLEISVPLPRPADDRETHELAYPRFSVVLDAERRFAAVTAVNIDGVRLLDLPRTGEWDFDERIPEADQAGNAVYRDNDLDRGHLVRRRDPGWGTKAEADAAMRATFFYTNAAPQAAGFNQSKELWLGLEDHVLEYAEAKDVKVSVFTAPVLDPEDPPYRGILIPRRFWKVAAWVTADEEGAPVLASAGFVLDQTDLIDRATSRAVAVEPLGGFRTFQVPVSEVEDLSGVDLGVLVAADTLARPGARGDRDARLLTSTADIVL